MGVTLRSYMYVILSPTEALRSEFMNPGVISTYRQEALEFRGRRADEPNIRLQTRSCTKYMSIVGGHHDLQPDAEQGLEKTLLRCHVEASDTFL